MKNIVFTIHLFACLLCTPLESYSQIIDTIALEQNILTPAKGKDLETIKKQVRQLAKNQNATAVRLAELGLQRAKTPTETLTFLEGLAWAYTQDSKFDDAKEQLDKAEKLAKENGLKQFLPAILLNRGNIYWKTQKLDDGLDAASQCAALASAMNDGDMVAKSQVLSGWILRLQGQNEKALEQFQTALNYFEKNKDETAAVNALNGLAATHYMLENLSTCIDYYLKARDYVSKNGLSDLAQNIETNLGFLYLRLEQIEKAKASMYRALHWAEQRGNLGELTHASANLGELYIHDKKPDSVRYFSHMALAYGEQVDDKIRIAGAHLNLADSYLEEKNYTLAAKHSSEAVALSEKSGDIYTKGYSLFQQGQVAEGMGQYRSALAFFNQSLAVFEQTGELSWQSRTTERLSSIQEKMGEPGLALALYKKSKTLEDSIQANEQLQKIAAIEKQFAIEKKEEEIKHLSTENTLLESSERKNRFIIGALVFILLLAGIVFTLAYRQRKLSLEKGLAEVKQQLLRHQMNPHFIFNALNSVQNQFLQGDAESSVLLMGKFSKLMRLVLNNSNETFVPLQDELEMLRIYLDLEQLRTNQKFEYVIQVGEEVDLYQVQLPSMITQIFVENAIWHGIAPKNEKGKITLNIFREKGSTIFSVEDNGVGRKYSLQSKTKSQKEHRSLGTQLVRERIKQINRKFAQNIKLFVRDLSGPSGEATGTKIELVF